MDDPERPSEPEARSLRLFVAFDVAPGAADEIERAIASWRDRLPGARWVPRENWHVTVKFLGQTRPSLEAWVGDRVGEAARSCGPVETRLSRLGRFPERGRARVLWAGLEDPAGRLVGIAATLDAALAEEVRPEARPFSAHLTFARSDPPLALPTDFVETSLEAVPTRVEAITLFRSHLGRPAPRYEPLRVFPLGG
jgi:2'-5' RNA ligase